MSLRRAIRDRILSRPAVLAAHAVTLLVLSRLLTPAEFGLFALAAVAHQIAVALADLGIKTQLLNSPSLDPHRHGEAFGLALTAACVVAAGFLGVALLLPDALAPPSLDATLWIFAAAVLLGPLELLFNIPLMQSMRFGLISVVNVFGAWIRCGVSIIAALYGAGPAALAAGLLAEQIVSFAMFAIARRNEQVPAPRMTGWRRLIEDGARLSGNQVIRHLSELGLMGAISGFLGVATLGVYNRADQVVKLFDKIFLNSFSPVIHPAFVQAIKDKHDPATIYLKKVELLTALIWPAFAMIAILADPLCRVVLGPGWDAAPVVVQLLALIGIARPFTQMNQALFIALGELRLSTRLDVQHHITRVALASCGALISLEAVCIALAMSGVIDAIRQTRAFARSTGYEKRQLFNVALNAFLLTLCTVAPAALALSFVSTGSVFLELILSASAGAVGFVLAVCVMRNVLFHEAQKALKRIF
ncbi:polysaccharide biosynthesis protein [Roseobacter denitrificans]|uniref:Polysaccharide biosynthesis protein, putative n=1 Tax=Roseobacter denitrificans (strain ATCC 33942 / OCh 114) TaxID=375451 RepID=Q169Y7_ROSDO|nr:oligosaccharide flippase family protein [Roseobacter denitrificans]ABG31206.1 polysaccharide biosynthesis protein, putative [Roseobacter denitrificans OCh 114]AVL54262.1 polysaccharide biosynthesis protein [Roseobacter denitrificans]SFF97956.1 Membrane protein involved in the export of O-antigen and teichoic acid [Roseobacter denitrificans OCh 114]